MAESSRSIIFPYPVSPEIEAMQRSAHAAGVRWFFSKAFSPKDFFPYAVCMQYSGELSPMVVGKSDDPSEAWLEAFMALKLGGLW